MHASAVATEETKLEQALAPLRRQLEDMRTMLLEEKKVQEELRKENASLRKELMRLTALLVQSSGGKKRGREEGEDDELPLSRLQVAAVEDDDMQSPTVTGSGSRK